LLEWVTPTLENPGNRWKNPEDSHHCIVVLNLIDGEILLMYGLLDSVCGSNQVTVDNLFLLILWNVTDFVDRLQVEQILFLKIVILSRSA
jgi:hypothetical protein